MLFRSDAEHALSMEVTKKLKLENERHEAAEARCRADFMEAGLILQRSVLEKQLLASVQKREQAEAAALAIAMANAKQTKDVVRIAAERATAENALAEATHEREQAESAAMKAAMLRVVPEKSPPRNAQTPKTPKTPKTIWRVGVSAAVALIVGIGIGIGYQVQTPAIPENTALASTAIAEKSKHSLVSVPIPPRAAGESLIELRLDTELKSLSRSLPATNEVNKLR